MFFSGLTYAFSCGIRCRLHPISHLNVHTIQNRYISSSPAPRFPASVTTVRKSAKPVSRKAALSLTPAAVNRLKELTSENGKLLRIGIKRKGCSGQSYTLDYVDAKGKFDEVVEQDNVKIVIEAKALFSLIGSEMDFVEDNLSSQFVFNNPNVKEMCGCGQSFMT